MSKRFAAPIRELSPRMIKAVCMMAGGSVALLRGVYLDVNGDEHLPETLDRLVARGIAERFVWHSVRRVRLTNPRGRWFAATALARVADMLVEREQSREDRIAEETDSVEMEARAP